MESTALSANRQPTEYSSGTAIPALDASLTDRLAGLVRRIRSHLLIQGVARIAAFMVLAALVQFALDYGVRGMRWSMRAALLGVVIAATLVIVWRRIVVPLLLRIETADVAKLVERRYPQLGSRLISAVRFAAGEVGSEDANSRPLMSEVIRTAPEVAGGLDFSTIFSPVVVRRAVMLLLIVLGFWTTAILAAPEKTQLWFARNVMLKEVPWPKRTRLIVDLPAGQLVGARGDDLTLTVRHEGMAPDEVEVFYTTVSGVEGRETLSVVGRDENLQYRYVFKNAREEFSFYLTGGDDTTSEYGVRLIERPRVESAEMHIAPPAYTRLESFTVGGADRSAQVLPGSTVRISIKTNKPVVSARLMAGETEVARATAIEPYVAEFVAKSTATYHFDLRDDVGLEDKNPMRFSLRMLKDDAPQARLRAPGVGEMITPQAVLPLEMQASDAYGLATVELQYVLTRESTEDGKIELAGFKAGMTAFSETLTWPVSAISVAAGDRLAIRGRAADFDDVSGPKVTESAELTVRIVTPDELLNELGRREHEFRMDFERLIDAQEQLRNKLLTLMDSSQSETPGPDFVSAVSALERRQRGIAGSVNVIRQQFEQVLTELRINQLSTEQIEERLGGSIVEPLAELGRRELAAAGDAFRTWSRDASRQTAMQIDAQQVILLKKLREILAHMIQWQGYQEAVTMLRDILRLQEELKTETKTRVREEGKGLFDD